MWCPPIGILLKCVLVSEGIRLFDGKDRLVGLEEVQETDMISKHMENLSSIVCIIHQS